MNKTMIITAVELGIAALAAVEVFRITTKDMCIKPIRKKATLQDIEFEDLDLDIEEDAE